MAVKSMVGSTATSKLCISISPRSILILILFSDLCSSFLFTRVHSRYLSASRLFSSSIPPLQPVDTDRESEYDMGSYSYEELKRLEKDVLDKKYGNQDSSAPEVSSKYPTHTASSGADASGAEEQDDERFDRELNAGSKPVPLKRECELYRWAQTDDWIGVSIPLPNPAIRDDIVLIVAGDSLRVKVKTSPELGVIGGKLHGNMEASSTEFHISNADMLNGTLDSTLDIKVQKKAAKGTYEMWYGLFYQEKESPTVKFGMEVFPSLEQSGYRWRQTKDFFTITLDIPDEVSKSDVAVDFSRDGKCWSCHVKQQSGRALYIGGRFYGNIKADESTWFIDSKGDSDIGYKQQLVLEVAKNKLKLDKDFERSWWPRLCQDETIQG